MNKIEKIKDLIRKLNEYRDAYYNNNAIVSDAVYDSLFDELTALENETGFVTADSPTQSVGYEVKSSLEKVNHTIPLLSLDKTKSVNEVKCFCNDDCISMLKLDGLTVELDYENGELVQASTRGNGDVGEIITHNAITFKNVMKKISHKEKLVITGEAFIPTNVFEKIKKDITDENGKPYKNSRNLASGSVRNLNSEICAQRGVYFMPFNVIDGLSSCTTKYEKLTYINSLGFEICPMIPVNSNSDFNDVISKLKHIAEKKCIPIDGIVFQYNDIAFSKSLGRTGHHYKDGIAFKFEDDLYETVLRKIEWNTSRTGMITPVAIFDTVEIDGCDVSRASLHNVSFIKKLNLNIGDRIKVSKRNMIIPHVEVNLDISGEMVDIPDACPCCGGKTKVVKSTANNTEVLTLFCDNENCDSKFINKLVHFVSKPAMNIDGLSKSTLQKLCDCGYISSYMDIYHLSRHRNDIVNIEGFGEKSCDSLLKSIEESRKTTFTQFIVAMDIPNIGKSASKELSKLFSNPEDMLENLMNGYDLTQHGDFGEITNDGVQKWLSNTENIDFWNNLYAICDVTVDEHKEVVDNAFLNKTVVVTGTLEKYTRNSITDELEGLGAKVSNSVSKKTDYLIVGTDAGSKFAKAKSLGVKILTEEEFINKKG